MRELLVKESEELKLKIEEARIDNEMLKQSV
jgi:hypothetical protein